MKDLDFFAHGARLALELECLLMDTRNDAAQSRWWASAHEALEQWRQAVRAMEAADAAPQQPAATSETVNVIGMPEFDGLLDHIYEHGTAAEGVIEKANAFARAVLAQYSTQQPAAVDEAMVKRFLEAFQNTPGDEAIAADEKVVRRWLAAALATQQQEPPHDRQD